MTKLTDDMIHSWADDARGPVALCLKQQLVPVEGEGGVIFPPTYADIGYNIDELSDGTCVATIDSVGSQANRIEPLFKEAGDGRPANPLAALVPSVTIDLGENRQVSLLDAGHRLGDAIVRASSLREQAHKVFETYLRTGEALPIAKLAPTSLVFGVWDSRDTSAKLPRIVQSVIRAWDVTKLRRSAQYGPPIDYAELDILEAQEKEDAEKNPKNPLAQRGFVHVPATGQPGGVVARGPIVRDVTINLIALRRLDSKSDGAALRRYILGLALVAATQPLDGFLRQGCLLTPKEDGGEDWKLVQRDGKRPTIALTAERALEYALGAAKSFGVGDAIKANLDKGIAKEDVELAKGGAKKKAAKAKAAK